MRSTSILVFMSLFSFNVFAAEWLMKASAPQTAVQITAQLRASGQAVLDVQDMRFNGWFLIRTSSVGLSQNEANVIGHSARAAWVEPNRRIRALRAMMPRGPLMANFRPMAEDPEKKPKAPMYKRLPPYGAGPDPQMGKQWSLADTGFLKVQQYTGNPHVIVAVLDTGIDYLHPELNGAIWMNPGEAGAKSANGIDDDANGYIDDFMGWNFAEKNNQPYDFTNIHNEGHGTHCAGAIAAARGNNFEVAGIASGVQIMPIRFMGLNGEGSDADAMLAVKYAVDNGAAVLSNSWGGADENNDDSRALREAFGYASTKGRLIVVAAGNETTDVDAKPLMATPASYNVPTQLTVAATDIDGNMASFSNYGRTMVHLGAPGVGILSTIPGGGMLSMDGTSMATPIVAAGAALFWSQRPELTALQVKQMVLASVTPTPSLTGKTLSGGRLNIEKLMSNVGHPPLRFW